MSCRLKSSPSKETKEKSSVSVRLKKATSPFFAASTKLFSAASSVGTMGLSGFSGATAVCAPARLTTLANSKPATNQNFMDPPLYHASTSIDQIGNPRQSVDALPVLLLAINLQAFFTPLLAPHGQFG